jgi:hypothetical protein
MFSSQAVWQRPETADARCQVGCLWGVCRNSERLFKQAMLSKRSQRAGKDLEEEREERRKEDRSNVDEDEELSDRQPDS